LIRKHHQPEWCPKLLQDIDLDEVEGYFKENNNKLF